MALKKVKGNLERMFDKNLTDLVRGIRNNRNNEAKYITQCMEEIKEELRQDNIAVKSNAVAKLAYLQMLGYDISWAAFNIIEVMSSSKFTFKRIGYLAASQSFHDETDVLMLTTNMIRKDLNSVGVYESGVAMSGLACFVTPDLARDLSHDVMTLLTSTKPYLRKKAVLLMYKIFLRFPDALRPAFPKLKEKLEDPDPGVQSAAVNVICELARKNPKNYLPLAPVFFKLMTSSSNNWMLIKIIKLFGALTPLEPRLGKKLIEPLTNLIHSTSAMSLLYECINTVIAVLISISSGLPSHSASIQLCVQKLRVLIEDSDQNLKYLGLLAMAKILKTHPKTVQSHKDLVLQCLDDKDESIRLRALDLLYGMVGKKNLQEIVRRLMSHVDKAEGQHYRDQLLANIIDICSQDNYHFITNFEWYIGILVELTRIEGTRHGELIASQMLDVAVRVEAVRGEACRQMAHLLANTPLLIGQKDSITQVLMAAAYICGEFSHLLEEPEACMENMLRPRAVQLPPHIQATFVQNVLKIYSSTCASCDEATFRRLSALLIDRLPMFVHSGDLEVQERTCCTLALVKQAVKLFDRGEDVRGELQLLFQGELNPVAPKAQKKVPLPEGLDLESWINEPPSDSDSDHETAGGMEIFFRTEKATIAEEVRYEPDEEEMVKRRKARQSEQADNPHYLKSNTKSKKESSRANSRRNHKDKSRGLIDHEILRGVDVNDDGGRPKSKHSHRNGERGAGDGDADGEPVKRHKKRCGKKSTSGGDRRKNDRLSELLQTDSEEEDEVGADDAPTVLVKTLMELPDGARASDTDDDKDVNDPHRALNIDLGAALEESVFSSRYSKSKTVGFERTTETPPVTAIAVGGNDNQQNNNNNNNASNINNNNNNNMKNTADVTGIDDDGLLIRELESKTERKMKKREKKEKKHKKDKRKDSIAAVDDGKASGHNSKKTKHDKSSGESKDKRASRKENRVSSRHQHQHTSNSGAPSVRATMSFPTTSADHISRQKKSDYEEAPGITTPSREKGRSLPQTPLSPSLALLQCESRFEPLKEDQNVKLSYEIRTMLHVRDQLVCALKFTNKSTHPLKQLELTFRDGQHLRFVRPPGADDSTVPALPFTVLPAGVTHINEFAFEVSHLAADQVKATLTYMRCEEDGVQSDKIDCKIKVPVVAYLVPTPTPGDIFCGMLSSGSLMAKGSLTIPDVDVDFSHLLSKLAFHAHFAQIELVGQSASLLATAISGEPVCLLVKQKEGGKSSNGLLVIDGKSSSETLLNQALAEINRLITSGSLFEDYELYEDLGTIRWRHEGCLQGNAHLYQGKDPIRIEAPAVGGIEASVPASPTRHRRDYDEVTAEAVSNVEKRQNRFLLPVSLGSGSRWRPLVENAKTGKNV
ncbi:AP-3 complex subunit delta-1 isoform X2-like [Tropilaelaps mercedesae]|uniref:AP-3 complex subunit delta n=1 Tax=Tropilaelaps mercedesae TaxID=418985 RepID=A0A1V9XMI0_9ACAR|nr:AP-3 complex subunit delta-1 isoform X2-like [Tropilaelaps mercedesae]